MDEDATVMEAGNSTMLTSGRNDREKKVVNITRDAGQTKITIVHTTDLH